MTMPDGSSAELRAILEELRQLRRETERGEDDLWNAIDEVRELLVRRGSDAPGGAAPAEEAEATEPEGYDRMKRRLRRFAATRVRGGGRVAVVSHGDDDLLEIPRLGAEHFPRTVEGKYAGYYPPDGTGIVAHLEWVRAHGARALLFPETSLWWLKSFPQLAAHLGRTCPPPIRAEGVGTLFDLDARAAADASPGWEATLGDLLQRWEEDAGEASSLLDWSTGRELAGRFPGSAVFSPPGDEPSLPYLDGSVDAVAAADDDPRAMAEARRVAKRAVLLFGGDDEAEVAFEHLEGAPPAPPPVSVVIPTYNGLRHLVPCVRALAATLSADFGGDVVVVDDGGDAETRRGLAALEARHAWLRVVRNGRNAGFIASCNRGAEEAQGEYLVFLNDDTVPLPGWLGALLRTFRMVPDAGVVGGRLVFPDGRLQEAGGVIYQDGSGANFGRNDYEVDAPLYSYLRRVDYCSGALLATPRGLFQRLGGFDTRYRPAYYEDTDYCFTVREAGLGVYYQPEAVVVHTEGATSGTDPQQGAKRHQAVNRGTFTAKWAGVLENLPSPPSSYSPLVWHRLAAVGSVR